MLPNRIAASPAAGGLYGSKKQIPISANVTGVKGLPSSVSIENGARRLRFVAPRVPPFGFREFRLEIKRPPAAVVSPFTADADSLQGPYYRLRVDMRNGGLASLQHRAGGQELVMGAFGRSLCQTVYHDGREHTVTNIECRAQFDGCTGKMLITGRTGDLRVTNAVTIYVQLDRVDFDIRIEKPPTTNEQRLLHFFPVGQGVKNLRIETPAAVIRPYPRPEGDLLPGADTRRFAVQGFVDISPADGMGVTISPVDAFMLRLDQGVPAFEAMGNDQNWKEVTQDQAGVRHFRFRYSFRAHAPGFDNANALAWSRTVVAPPAVARGRLPGKWLDRPHLALDPARGIVTCFKPSDDGTPGKTIARFWEIGGLGAPVSLLVPGVKRAASADLLEEKGEPLVLMQGRINVPVRPLGLSGVILE